MLKSDGNGSTIVEGLKPHQIGVGVLVTILIFVGSIVYAFGAKNQKLETQGECIKVLEKKMLVVEEMDKRLVRIETILIEMGKRK